MSLPIGEVLARARQGEHDAFALIYDGYSRAIHSFTYRLLGNLAQADEITQETFLRAWQRLGQLRDDDRLEGWLYSIAAHLCTDAHRRKLPSWLPFQATDEDVADPGSDVASVLAEHELVESVLARLPAKYSAVLVLRHVEGFSCGEIAEMLSISVDNVWQRLSRGRDMFMKAYRNSSAGGRT